MSSDDFKAFYTARHKELLAKGYKGGIGSFHIYDEEGNLVTKNKQGEVQQTLVIPSYRPLSLEEVDVMEKERQEQIATAMKAYDDAFDKLHDEYQRQDRSDQKILQYTREVTEADHQLQFVRYPLRYVERGEGIEIRRLMFDQPNETRKLPYSIGMMKTSPFPLQQLYVRQGVAPAKEALQSVAEIRKAATGPVILFEDSDTNEYGFMAMDWPVQITIRSATYHCAKQALAAELAKTFKDDEKFREIMSAETPAEVSFDMEDVKASEQEWAEATKRILYDVQSAKFRQYPELQERLLATQNATIGAYQPNDTILGIGISLDHLHAKNPIHWKGQNLLGTVLMEIRSTLKKELEEKQKEQPKKRLSTKRPLSKPVVESAPAAAPVAASAAPVASSITAPVASLTTPQAAELIQAPASVSLSSIPAKIKKPLKKPEVE
jgi:ribA/ribD-fused uncharacterized protein